MAGVQAKKRKASTLEVLLRIRPYKGANGCVQIVDEEHVKLIPPADAPLNRRGEIATETAYTYAYIFEMAESQRAVFDRAAIDMIENLIKAVNGLLFTYGVTGSGKTFTMAGSGHGDNSGLIPRSADVLFNSIKNQQEKCIFTPNGRNGFYVRGRQEALLARSHLPAPEFDMKERMMETKRVFGYNKNMACSVFISYVEIYNDSCYDLLDDSLGENRLNQTKNIRTDANGVNFVEKVCEIEVSSSDEVLEQYVKAQEKRKMAKTALNDTSSRSHSIFTIRLVQAPFNEDGTYPTTDESKIVVSQMCLVDLAGSERTKRTGNQGERLVEAGKINQSLLVLRRCFEQLRENQRRNGGGLPVPYRDQKLTTLFKSYFEGHGNIRMIVCVNPRPADFEENQFVMSFAEIAQSVDVPESVIPTTMMDMSNQKYTLRDMRTWDAELHHRLESVQSSVHFFSKPPPIRIQSMDDVASLIALREYYTTAERTRAAKVSNMKIHEADLKKILQERLRDADLDLHLMKEKDDEIEYLREANSSLTNERNKYKRDVTGLQIKLSRYEGEVMNHRRRDEDDRRRQLEQNQAMMKQREAMKTIYTEMIPPLPQCKTEAPSSQGRVAQLATIFADENRAPGQGSTKAKQFVRTAGGQHVPAPVRGRVGGVGFANNRFGKIPQRRSRSVGSKVLNHQPANKIPTGTIFQPDYPSNTKHTAKLKAHDLKSYTDYVITNQEVDEGGNLSTHHYKGDIVPTAGGGTSVMFRDVERLTQESP